ncbi:hypothetical protein OC861_001643 [Tilletia horrida]|nr:hypothetical protein OC861_001643 [Tilletia horrida]
MDFQTRVLFHIVFGTFSLFIFCFITLAWISTKANERLIRETRHEEVPRRSRTRSRRPRSSRSGSCRERNVGPIQSTREIMRAILTGSDRPVSDEEYYGSNEIHVPIPALHTIQPSLASEHRHVVDLPSPRSDSSSTSSSSSASPASLHSSSASTVCSTQPTSSNLSPVIPCPEMAMSPLTPSLSDPWGKLGWDWVRAGEDGDDGGADDVADRVKCDGLHGIDIITERAHYDQWLRTLNVHLPTSTDICEHTSLAAPPSSPLSFGASSIRRKRSSTMSNSSSSSVDEHEDESFDSDGTKDGDEGESVGDRSVGLGISDVLDSSTSSISSSTSSASSSRSACPSLPNNNRRASSSRSSSSSVKAAQQQQQQQQQQKRKKKVIRKCPSHDCVCDELQQRILCPLLEEESVDESY